MSESDLMADLGFALERHTTGPGPQTVPCVRDSRGVLRRATDEEARLWEALAEARAALAEARVPAAKKSR
jgi:hypothetical protein